ncbi:MAG TPA: archaellin/type IV pilin N-terminal domain-containing protein [Thermoplasmata archaeon]|nr:archaellin/type IV pilin N-terminal domain-containing protein [Thermoplasmata archaeon]
MWSEKARSFRKPNKRGVSPIIATILLVAITVVLAAVLYILISGFTKGPGNTPIGTAFTFGTPQKTIGTAATNTLGSCATGDQCYNLAVGSAGGGITAAGMNFVIHDSAGNPVAFAGAKVTLISSAPTVIATYTISTGTWAGTPTTGLSTTQEFVLDLGCASGSCAPNPTGEVIVALGVGSYSGQVTATLT